MFMLTVFLLFPDFQVYRECHGGPTWFQHMAANSHSSDFFSVLGVKNLLLPSRLFIVWKLVRVQLNRGRCLASSNLISPSIIDAQHFHWASLGCFLFTLIVFGFSCLTGDMRTHTPALTLLLDSVFHLVSYIKLCKLNYCVSGGGGGVVINSPPSTPQHHTLFQTSTSLF